MAPGKRTRKKIKRRQTGFARSEDLEQIHLIKGRSKEKIDDDDEDSDDSDSEGRKVRIAGGVEDKPAISSRAIRRPTGFVRPAELPEESDSDTKVRPSVLVRLFDDVTADEEPPTLKNYKPMSETNQKNILLTFSPNFRVRSDESTREKFLRHSMTVEDNSLDHVLELQHGQKVARKISSDYVKTIDQIEHRLENSIRSVEFAKTRPAMSVADYQLKNKKYQEEQRNS